LLVTAVDENSDYADRLATDVLILQIDREDVSDLDSARKALTPGRHMLFVYFRGALRVVGIEVK
jgi:serine protease Do/serine protease DegQ